MSRLASVGGQIRANPRKKLFTDLVRFQQMPKLADRRLVRHGLATQINAHKLPHGVRVVQRLFDRRIRQVEARLQTMQPQPTFDSDRWTPGAFGLGIDRLNRGYQLRPGHDAVHLPEELFASGGLAIPIKCDFGKCLLIHGVRLPFRLRYPSHITREE
jgi:hypothetical protein